MIETFLTHWNIQLRNACKIAIRNGTNPVVYGDLDLRSTLIRSLPDGLEVGGFLNLSFTLIKSLPKNLIVSGNLNLVGSSIRSLSSDLKVGGNLYLYGTLIESLPGRVRSGRRPVFISQFNYQISTKRFEGQRKD